MSRLLIVVVFFSALFQPSMVESSGLWAKIYSFSNGGTVVYARGACINLKDPSWLDCSSRDEEIQIYVAGDEPVFLNGFSSKDVGWKTYLWSIKLDRGKNITSIPGASYISLGNMTPIKK